MFPTSVSVTTTALDAYNTRKVKSLYNLKMSVLPYRIPIIVYLWPFSSNAYPIARRLTRKIKEVFMRMIGKSGGRRMSSIDIYTFRLGIWIQWGINALKPYGTVIRILRLESARDKKWRILKF